MISNYYYSAAWTECGCFITCPHEHRTVIEARSCIPCAGGYVVAVVDGATRSLAAEEEEEFQCTVPSNYADNAETIPATPAETLSVPGFAVMTRIRVGHHLTWTTWMCFETYAEAAAHVREGDKVVRFRSAEWEALRRQTERASPIVTSIPRERGAVRGEEETLLEFVLRFVSTYGLAQHSKSISNPRQGSTSTDVIDLVLRFLNESETRDLERMCDKDKLALLDALRNRLRALRKSQGGGH